MQEKHDVTISLAVHQVLLKNINKTNIPKLIKKKEKSLKQKHIVRKRDEIKQRKMTKQLKKFKT